MVPGDEYTAGGGGKLKLKGFKVSDGRVEKKKKKSKKSKSDKEGEVGSATPEARHPDEDGRSEDHHPDPAHHTPPDDAGATVGKTEAERKYEEARKKRVCIILPTHLLAVERSTNKGQRS
jgi:protein FAM32A